MDQIDGRGYGAGSGWGYGSGSGWGDGWSDGSGTEHPSGEKRWSFILIWALR